MAEALAALGAIASLAQLADYGFRLSIKLYSYGEAVSKADGSIKSLSNDVSLTSAVLKELGAILADEDARFVSERAVEATKMTVEECFLVFDQLNAILEKSIGSDVDKDGRSKTSRLEKLRWPFLQPKVDLLRSNLDRLKASLTLMLQVLSYAKDVSEKRHSRDESKFKEEMIDSLYRSEQAALRKYDALRRLLDHQQSSDIASREPDLSSPPPYAVNALSMSGQAAMETGAEAYHSDDKNLQVGELLISFHLTQNVLNQHINAVSDKLRYQSYQSLRRAVETAQDAEVQNLEHLHGAAAWKLRSESARNALLLQKALHKLARSQEMLNPSVPSVVSTDFADHSALSLPKSQRQGLVSPPPVVPLPETISEQSSVLPPPVDLQRPDPSTSDGAEGIQSSGPFRPQNDQASSITLEQIQAEVDETNKLIHEFLPPVLDHGEKLDSLGENTEKIAASAQLFRSRQKQTRFPSWQSVTETVASYGNTGLKTVQGVTSNVYQAGSSLLLSPTVVDSSEDDTEQDPSTTGVEDFLEGGRSYAHKERIVDEAIESSEKDSDRWTENQSDHEDDAIVRDLLSKWTNVHLDEKADEHRHARPTTPGVEFSHATGDILAPSPVRSRLSPGAVSPLLRPESPSSAPGLSLF